MTNYKKRIKMPHSGMLCGVCASSGLLVPSQKKKLPRRTDPLIFGVIFIFGASLFIDPSFFIRSRLLKLPIFVVQKGAAPKNEVEFYQMFIGTIKCSLAISYGDVQHCKMSLNFFATHTRNVCTYKATCWCCSAPQKKNKDVKKTKRKRR